MCLQLEGICISPADFNINTGIDISPIPVSDPFDVSDISLLRQLDSFTKPGLSEVHFQKLFAKCRGCGLYMIRKAVDYHDCSGDVWSSSSTGEEPELEDINRTGED
jgi:hypothetical protein